VRAAREFANASQQRRFPEQRRTVSICDGLAGDNRSWR